MNQFELLRTHAIPTLQASLVEYRHPATGARHIHLSNDQADLAFLVAFPTVPDNSDGRAHILEHLSLSGSERYPVRNPFFSMMRRSTATFMNAMTYADRTVYPFASTDATDYFNLLDVYLDATFFPKLDYLNFLQEGWRHVFEGDRLTYQGVVFNEMKGAFADPRQALYQGVTAALLQGTTYSVVSGGDPLEIPNLGHEALKRFHAAHYHPSQAVFMTAGPIPAADIQKRIAERVLSKLTGAAPPMLPQLAAVHAPRQATVRVPAQGERDDGFGIQLAWILGEASDSTVFNRARVLHAGLLGGANAPVRKAMESAGYGRPSRLNGMDNNPRQLVFHLGMEGLMEHQLADARIRIEDALQQVAREGVPETVLRAALRDIRYRQRDTGSNMMPNVLARMLAAVPVSMRGGDIVPAFDSEQTLAELEQRITEPGFFPSLVRELLDSPARLTATVVPDPEFFSARDAAEAARLARESAAMDTRARRRIEEDNAALLALQREPADTGSLPRIRPGDVSPRPRPLPTVLTLAGSRQALSIASNGISYARVQYDVSALSEQDWPWLQLYAALRRDLGVAGLGYDEADAWRQRAVPALDVYLAPVLADGSLSVGLSFQASGLREDHAGIAEVLDTYIQRPRFDEYARIGFLCTQLSQQRLKNLAQMGDQYARLASGTAASALRRFEDAVDGVAYLPFLLNLQRQVATAEGTEQIACQLKRIHELLTACPASLVCAGSDNDAVQLAAMIDVPNGSAISAATTAPRAVPGLFDQGEALALYAPGQVNHCHIAWPVPDERHPDAAALAVAAELLTHRFLHTAIREKGGAYGGSAGYAAGAGVFMMRSYRDPRLLATYADFAEAVTALGEAALSTEQVEEAIITVIKGLDRPLSPFDAVLGGLNMRRRGITEKERADFRQAVLSCTADEVKTAVTVWLRPDAARRAAFVGDAGQDLSGFRVVDLNALANAGQASAQQTGG